MNTIDNSQRTAAKVAGWSGVLTFAIVVFGNYVLLNPLVVPGNAVATAQNMVAHQTQVRIAGVCFLTYSLGVIVLLTALYVILKPINPGLALVGALFRLVFGLLWLLAPLNLLGALRLLSNANYLQVFEPDRLQALARLHLGANFDAYYVGLPFFGLAANGLRLVVAQVYVHPERTGDLWRNLIRLVRALRFCFSHLPELQQNRERLHLRHTDGYL